MKWRGRRLESRVRPTFASRHYRRNKVRLRDDKFSARKFYTLGGKLVLYPKVGYRAHRAGVVYPNLYLHSCYLVRDARMDHHIRRGSVAHCVSKRGESRQSLPSIPVQSVYAHTVRRADCESQVRVVREATTLVPNAKHERA